MEQWNSEKKNHKDYIRKLTAETSVENKIILYLYIENCSP